MLKPLTQGIFKEVSLPLYGFQEQGIAPGGAADGFALETAVNLLGVKKREEFRSWEMILPPRWEFQQNLLGVLTGAPCNFYNLILPSGEKKKLEEGVLFYAPQGSVLQIGQRLKGFRIYLTVSACGVQEKKNLNRRLPQGKERFRWIQEGVIRVVDGPEEGFLNDRQGFFQNYWRIGLDSDDRGLRLEGQGALKVSLGNMVSDAVADGTVQLTPKGPIILLHSRQTVGGYPRIYNIISADVDLLAQYVPGQILHFQRISLEKAREIAKMKDEISRKIILDSYNFN